ncbi:hypothetical protein HMPREF1324_0636 [Rothia aeria F0474]|uniref:Uncharacterized protein n=1 Tax=Rothia aeria F0474 TaxID=1125724 RepID=I0UTF1_9MICC|nr:hypothetical protein HMPREF1324_0636 [Rothia aeria F0474]
MGFAAGVRAVSRAEGSLAVRGHVPSQRKGTFYMGAIIGAANPTC